MTFLEALIDYYDPTNPEPAVDHAQFLAAEFAAMDAGKYHPAVRPVRGVDPESDPSMVQYDRAIASLSPDPTPTLH
ncbi:hypothetical protein ACYZT8_20345 [Pseudomonas sp. LB3P93]